MEQPGASEEGEIDRSYASALKGQGEGRSRHPAGLAKSKQRQPDKSDKGQPQFHREEVVLGSPSRQEGQADKQDDETSPDDCIAAEQPGPRRLKHRLDRAVPWWLGAMECRRRATDLRHRGWRPRGCQPWRLWNGGGWTNLR